MIIFVCLLTLGLLGLGKATGSIIETVISGFFYLLVTAILYYNFHSGYIVRIVLVAQNVRNET